MARHDDGESHGGGGGGHFGTWHRIGHGSGRYPTDPTGRIEPDELIEFLNPERFPYDADVVHIKRTPLDDSVVTRLKDVGEFWRPTNNFWLNHKAVVLNRGLQFNGDRNDPKHYPFDLLVQHFAKNKAIFDPKNRHYPEYANVRLNLAVMRNFLLDHLFPDGASPEVQAKMGVQYDLNTAHMLQMGHAVGQIIGRGNSWLPSIKPSLSPAMLNVEGVGAARLYEKLLTMQHVENLIKPVAVPYRIWEGLANRTWRLPGIEETPFHAPNLTAGADQARGDDPDDVPPAPTGPLPPIVGPENFEALAIALAPSALPFAKVEDLEQPIRRQAIQHARDILDKLKITFSAVPVAQLLDFADPVAARGLFNDLNEFSNVFRDHLARALVADPQLNGDPEVHAAMNALGAMAFQAQRFALRAAEEAGDQIGIQYSLQAMHNMPEDWKHPGAQTFGGMLGQMDRGLEKVLSRLETVQQETDSAGAVALGQEAQFAQDPGMSATPGQLGKPAAQSAALAQHQQSKTLQAQQQVMAADQLHMNRHNKEQAHTNVQLAAAPPPRGSNSRPATVRPMKGPKPAKDLTALPQPQGGAGLGNLLSADQVARMRSSLSAQTIGPPINGPKPIKSMKETVMDAGLRDDKKLKSSRDELNPNGRPNGPSRS